MLRVFLASDFDGAHQPFKGDLDQADLKALCIALSPFFLMIQYCKLEWWSASRLRSATGPVIKKPS
jgi:hypothetical protein